MSSNQIEEYSPEELEKLVGEALKETGSSDGRALFSYGDTRILQQVYKVLAENIGAAQTTVALDEVRSTIYDGIDQDKSQQLRSLHGMVQRCTACPKMNNPELPKWNLQDPDVLFLGAGPLSGNEGDRLFISTMKNVGFRSVRIAYSSVTRCTPEKNRAADSTEISECSKRYLFDEIRLLSPKLIVTLGSVATSILLGDNTKITEERGNIFWAGPWAILPTYPGSYALRSQQREKEFIGDIKKAYEFLYGR